MRKSYLFLLLILMGCQQQNYLAPVEELQWHSYIGRPARHIVRSGETIYAIAFRYDLDFRTLLKYNHLKNSRLYIGQVLHLPYSAQGNSAWQIETQGRKSVLARNKQPFKLMRKPPNIYPTASNKATGKWVWPALGKIISNFNPQLGKKGIDIAGRKGTLIYAAAPGIVAYSGNGLAGYGNLIIIKHSDQFLTAYGNNLNNRVQEGQIVKAGQIIADMGIVDRKFWGVHFEIRKAGQPVNPVVFLPKL
ncbi:peptidoglycan DD-metalloendopeptidase family protein [Legionella sp. D16C41]|uniref:peptidoglycan DD-metalloendopeptidase family protein n=1 Tax=Legionella sp. D16C41 TaxID=3402688 RepID=UPI003AF46D67